MAQVTPEELEAMRAQLRTQQQKELARKQLLTIQHERDEAQRVLNELRQHSVQNAQQIPIGQPPPQNQQIVSSQSSDISSLVSAMGFSQLEYKIPKFRDENDSHPLEFLEKMKNFFKVKNISEEKKMASIEIAMDGNARLWFNTQGNFASFESFEVAFKARFFSIPVQVKIKNKWSIREYNDKKDGNFQNYYYEQLKEASYILPKMSEYEKNYVIIKQFPWWVQEALASANFDDANAIANTLANLDAIRSEKQAKRKYTIWSNRKF